MEAVFSLILDMSLTASLVIAVILLIRLLLKKAPKKYSYSLWLVAAFRLICPVSLEASFSLFNLSFGGKNGASLKDVPVHIPPTNIAPAQPIVTPELTPTAPAFPDIVPSPTPGAVQTVPAEPEAAVSLMGVLAIIWCIGMATLLIYSVASYIKLHRQMSTAVLLEGNVRQAAGIRSPFILGFLRPQIYIPYHLSDTERNYVLAHERCHLKRGDHIVKPLAFLILVLHWFNPLVWLAFHLMVKDMEMSCDEKVLSQDESIRKDYSSTLLSFAAGRAFPAPSPLSFGEGSVKSRIKNILNWKKPALWLTVAAIVICIVVIAVCGTNARTNKSTDDPFGSEFTLSEAIFTRDNGVTLFFEVAKTIRLENNAAVYANGELLGTFEQTTLTADNWDNYLTGASGTWLSYSAKELRKNNSRAWRSVNGDRMYYLLLQEDGTVYLSGGYYDSEGEYDSESDDSNIFCIYRLAGEFSGIRWHYVPYEHPDYFPLEFDFDYSSIRFISTEGRVRSVDANGESVSGIDLEITSEHSEVGWQPDIDANMNASLRLEGNREKGAPVAEIFFTATLPDGETLSGTLVVSRPDKRERYLYEITLNSDSLGIKRNPDGGAIIYTSSADAAAPTPDTYAPVSCLYMAPHSSEYPWGGDSGCRYIISSDSFTVERISDRSAEIFPVDSWNLSNVLTTTSAKWLEMFIGDAPDLGNMNVFLYQQISDEYSLLILDGQYHVVEMSGDYVWAIYAVVPEAQLGSAVWEYRPELSSRAPWFEFEFDMDYDNLQISTSVGTLFSDGSRYADTQLGLPAGSTVRWSPAAKYGDYSGTQLQFTINFTDGSMIQGTIYISCADNRLYTATLRANGLYLSNDEEYGHAVIAATADNLPGTLYPPAQPEDTTPFTTDLDELLNKWQAEGVTELSAEQLAQLNKNFVPDIMGKGNRLSSFFQCYYERPEDINLAEFLRYNFVSQTDYSEEDFKALKRQYPTHGQLHASKTYADAKQYGNPIHKFPREKVDEQLMRYAGITTAELSYINTENTGLVYLEESDAFFNFTSDMGAGTFHAYSGIMDGDTVYLYSGFTTLTLRKSGDCWLIYSHTYDSNAATRAVLANGILEIFDIGGEMDISLHTGDQQIHKTITVTDRAIAEKISKAIADCSYEKLEVPLTKSLAELSEYWISIVPTMPTNKMVFWSGDMEMLQYSPRGRHSYYSVSSATNHSLAAAVRAVYEELAAAGES